MGWMMEILTLDSQQEQGILLFSKTYKQRGCEADCLWKTTIKF